MFFIGSSVQRRRLKLQSYKFNQRKFGGKNLGGSRSLVVQAYRNRLPAKVRGIQFTSEVYPQKGSGTPYEARWYYDVTPGVLLVESKV